MPIETLRFRRMYLKLENHPLAYLRQTACRSLRPPNSSQGASGRDISTSFGTTFFARKPPPEVALAVRLVPLTYTAA